MGAYDRQIASARRLIAQKGCAIQIVTFTDGAPVDPATPWRSGSVLEKIQDTVGVFVASSKEKRGTGAGDPVVNEPPAGQTVAAARCEVLVPGQDVTVQPGIRTVLRAGGVEWKVTKVDPLAPDGVPILYTLTVER